MYWNYRQVTNSKYTFLAEVFYNDDGSLMGYSQADLMGDNPKDLKRAYKRAAEAFIHGPIPISDFPNVGGEIINLEV